MTVLNTFSNMGSMWVTPVSMYLVDNFTVTKEVEAVADVKEGTIPSKTTKEVSLFVIN